MITLAWLKHVSGKVVRVMLDYVDHVKICWKLEAVLKEQELWPDIHFILSKYLLTFLIKTRWFGIGAFLVGSILLLLLLSSKSSLSEAPLPPEDPGMHGPAASPLSCLHDLPSTAKLLERLHIVQGI